MARIVAQAFIADVRALVSINVKKEINDIVQDPSNDGYEWSRARARSLKKWIKAEEPLNYGKDRMVYADLVRAISPEEEHMAKGLPPSTRSSWSVEAFVDHIHKWAVSNVVSPRAPLFKGGSTGVVLRAILRECARILAAYSQEDRNAELKAALVRAFTAAHIHFIPDALPNPRGRGSPSHQPSIHAWTILGDAPLRPSNDSALARTHGERLILQLHRSADSFADSDVRGDWSLENIKIQDIHLVANRVVLPNDWAFGAAAASTNGTTRLLYNWAARHFEHNMQHWTSQLALALAVMLARALPAVFFPRPAPPALQTKLAQQPLSKPDRCIAAIRAAPWTSPPSSIKGIKEKPLYITQAILWLLAWIHEDSPLRVAIDARNTSDYKDFFSKHAHKGQNPVNLARLGIVYGNSKRMFGPCRIIEDYNPRTTADLQKWAKTVKTSLANLPEDRSTSPPSSLAIRRRSPFAMKATFRASFSAPFAPSPPPSPGPTAPLPHPSAP
ncbi:hypothetical protein FKP32DRAFT_1671157 [Trametes sanguinea]|nr:hypothetical protein FKP32DRAFT_1671157 [Trametes sanguinea]